MLSRQFARSLRRGPTAVSARVAGSRAVLAHSWSESSTAQTNAAIQTRPLSSLAPHIARAYPQYAIHGEAHMLNIKMIVPGYRLIKGESIAVDNSKKGRMLLEFTPRGSSGNYLWSDTVRFALSCEEVGLLISQLPQYEVELSRAATNSQDIEDTSKFGAITNDMPDKVLRITPGEGASVKFMLDFVRDGVGGQSPGVGQDGSGPMEVVTQAGEFEVISSIMKSSLPILAGWSPLIDIAVRASINDAAEGGGSYGGNGGGRGASSGGGARFDAISGDLPF